MGQRSRLRAFQWRKDPHCKAGCRGLGGEDQVHVGLDLREDGAWSECNQIAPGQAVGHHIKGEFWPLWSFEQENDLN